MSNQQTAYQKLVKSEEFWSMECGLVSHEITTGVWLTTQWQLTGFNLQPDSFNERVATLQLHRDERTDYRFNLSSQQPKLFLVVDIVEDEQHPKIVTLTASQSAAVNIWMVTTLYCPMICHYPFKRGWRLLSAVMVNC